VIEAQMAARSFADQQFKEGELLVVTPRQARVFVEA
jgi:sulfate transport system ATP-binding protein